MLNKTKIFPVFPEHLIDVPLKGYPLGVLDGMMTSFAINHTLGKSRVFEGLLESYQEDGVDLLEKYCTNDALMSHKYWFPYVHEPYENLTELVKRMIDIGCDPRYNLTINYVMEK